MKTPFKLKGMDFGNSPLKQNEVLDTGGGEGEGKHAKILAKYGWSGLTREEARATVKFSSGGNYEEEKKRKFYEIYGELNRKELKR